GAAAGVAVGVRNAPWAAPGGLRDPVESGEGAPAPRQPGVAEVDPTGHPGQVPRDRPGPDGSRARGGRRVAGGTPGEGGRPSGWPGWRAALARSLSEASHRERLPWIDRIDPLGWWPLQPRHLLPGRRRRPGPVAT